MSDAAHVAADQARLAFLAGWELDFRNRRYVRMVAPDATVLPLTLAVSRAKDGSDTWTATIIHRQSCGCVAMYSSDGYSDSHTARQSVDRAVQRVLTTYHNHTRD